MYFCVSGDSVTGVLRVQRNGGTKQAEPTAQASGNDSWRLRMFTTLYWFSHCGQLSISDCNASSVNQRLNGGSEPRRR